MCLIFMEPYFQEHSVKFMNIQGYINEVIKFKDTKTLSDLYIPWADLFVRIKR